MRFDYTVFVAGLFAGIAATVTIAMFIDFQWIRTSICLADETPLVCARNWFHVLAVIAGGVAAFIVVGQIRSSERHHREAISMQTLEMRSKFSRILRMYVEPVEIAAHSIIALGRTDPKDFRATVNQLNAPFIDLQRKIDKIMQEIEPYDDGRVAHEHAAVISRLEEFQRNLPIQKGEKIELDDKGFRLASPDHLANAVRTGVKIVNFTEAYRIQTDNGSGRLLPEIQSRQSILSVLLKKK